MVSGKSMNPGLIPLVAAVVTSVVCSTIAFRKMFGETKDFWECVFYSLKPDFISWMNKDLQRDYGKSMKLFVFLFLSIASGVGVYAAIGSFMLAFSEN